MATLPPKHSVHEHLLVCRIFMLTYSQREMRLHEKQEQVQDHS